jgi:hypothetical protein
LTRRTAVTFVVAIGIFAHWPALLSDSIMWDDWLVLSWIAQSRPDWAFHFYNNYSVTPFVLIDLVFVALVRDAASSVQIAKVVFICGVIASAVLITLISERVARGNRYFATLAGIAAVCFPASSGEGFHVSSLVYATFVPLFFAGMLMFIRLASSAEPRLGTRLFALAALLLSFTQNSLLVFFYALVPAVLYASLPQEARGLRGVAASARGFLLRHLDFLLLPVLFWVLKQTLMPRVGIYARYNAMRFDWSGILQGYERLIPDLLQTVAVVPFSIGLAPWLAALAFALVFLGARRFSHPSADTMGAKSMAALLVLGFFALLGTALPYYVVGRRSFQAFGFMSRDNVLFPLCVAWITAALFCLVPLRRIALGAFAALMIAQCISHWRNHADWQAHYAYYRSAIEKIRHDAVLAKASVLEVVDRLPGDRSLRSFRYPTSIWTGIVAAAFGKTTRLAIPYPPGNGRYFTRQEIEGRVLETEVAFMLGGVEFDGPQTRLVVDPGPGARSPTRLALDYWRARFFAPQEMSGLLDSLTRVSVEPLVPAAR